ncbi:sensor domain-containing diguanylate cyclase [Aurantiacibacter odishensis]|uniref:GGDEF domain-containing protein n=1 Tax=Aurantiacibacter odishensis TaxID=1155476 RepID=UPI0013C520CF|nr:GGDEF domain-containing protein [Aurantiacibacter odishensis]
MTALVAGLCVVCALAFAALHRNSAVAWMAIALAIGVLESLALKDGNISRLDLWLTAATVPMSYVCVGESIRSAYGRARSSWRCFAISGAAVLASLLFLLAPLPPVLQFLPAQLVGAAALARAVAVVRQDGRKGDFIDVGLAVTLSLVTAIYIVRVPVFPVLVGLGSPFAAIPRQSLQDMLIIAFAVLVPAVVFLTLARVILNALQTYRLRAEHDFLTSLPNRRAFESVAGHRTRGTGSLVVCDIDNFKRINDGFGHSAGDAVIRAVASLLEGRGMAARIGGEEFAIWMPRTSVEDARQHAEKLRGELMSLKVIELADDYRITASFGVAPCGRDIPLSQAMIAADRALYMAKNSGRNRVCIGTASRPEPKREPLRERAAA